MVKGQLHFSVKFVELYWIEFNPKMTIKTNLYRGFWFSKYLKQMQSYTSLME